MFIFVTCATDGTVLTLADWGALIWHSLPRAREELVDEVADATSENRTMIAAAVGRFVDDLSRRGLVVLDA